MPNPAYPLVLCFGLLAAWPAYALDEMFEVRSRTITDEDFLRGDDSTAAPVKISGRLSGPDTAKPAPVVILLHGTDGARSGAAGAWRAYLNGLGVTTLRLDSYTARGLDEVSNNQGAFGQFIQIYDAYRAADSLAADPRIDGSRIVLMGFSRGGNAALYSAMTRFQDAFGPERAEIAAYLPFYPACNFELLGELDVTSAPIRLFHGSEDDWTPASSCRSYLDRLAEAGADAVMTEYPGALHGFDNPSNPSLYADPDNMTSRACLRREKDGRLLNAATGQPFTYDDACIQFGPASQYNDAAATAAQEAVTSLLEAVFERSLAP